MLEIPVRKFFNLCPSIALAAMALTLFASCATEQKRTVLITDPDAERESSIPWNKPAKWETGANVPSGLGGSGGPGGGIDY